MKKIDITLLLTILDEFNKEKGLKTTGNWGPMEKMDFIDFLADKFEELNAVSD